MPTSKQRVAAMFGIAIMLVLSVAGAAASTVVTVLPGDVGATWSTADTRSGGTVSFVPGPATPPLGTGSLQMTTTDAYESSQAKAQLFNYSYIGTPLADIDALSFWAYKSSSSTNSAAQTMGLNIEVDYVGDGISFTTLVFEPIYQSGGPSALLTDTWQYWNAYNSGNGIWWSTKSIPGVCAFDCFVPWSTIIASNPNAKISGGLGFNVGSGWVGQSSENADALVVSVSGNETIYDFEATAPPPTDKDQCKNGGWQQFSSPAFKNQGQCVSYVQANAHAGKH